MFPIPYFVCTSVPLFSAVFPDSETPRQDSLGVPFQSSFTGHSDSPCKQESTDSSLQCTPDCLSAAYIPLFLMT